MKSTGEVMGIDRTFEGALAKALLASDLALRPHASILLSVSDRTKAAALPLIHQLADAGYRMFATEGTATTIAALGLPVTSVTKVLSGAHPNVVDVINDGTVQCVINTPRRTYDRLAPRWLSHPPGGGREAHPLLHVDRDRPRRDRGAHDQRFVQRRHPR